MLSKKIQIFILTLQFIIKISYSEKPFVPHFGFAEEHAERDSRIIHGQAAVPHSAPFIVSLKRNPTGSHFCGGSLITTTMVLTAAHCLQRNIYIVAGLHDRHDEKNVQIIKVKEFFKHEKYLGGVGPFDIAILHLEKAVELNDNVKLIKLPSGKEQQNGEAILYGWGKDKPDGGLPAILQTVTTDLLPFEKCKLLLPDSAPIHESNICSGSRNQTISACNGDSGGPLVQQKGTTNTNSNDETVQVGIVSWGYIPCGEKNYPSVYTHTGAHLEWIKKKIPELAITQNLLQANNYLTKFFFN